jgi:uncharacterized protein (TIRG00374 family)
MIPLLPGGLGAVEVMMVALFASAGVPNEISVAVTIIERGISFWLPIFVGLLLLPYYGYSSDDVKATDTEIIEELANNQEIEDIFDNKKIKK